ncbi:IclR family transcriptional regulator [Orrella marina]|uniref:IclR family transcriptional regulator n=2 Tax=Orrella marina TaxID=2163011 RepID=A0A2R4XFX6_9BURK|nr:IclR family transcriptional regulator [Orrella marina]
MTTENLRSGTQTIQRCALLLRLITTHNRAGMRLIDLYRGAGLTRPTTHRILQALVAEGLVRQDENNRRYYLGSLVYEMGVAAAPPLDLRDICQPMLQRVAQETGDTVFLTIRSGLDGVCIGRAEGAFPIKAFVLDIGRRRPLNIGGGALAILSALPDDEIERIWSANRARIEQNYPTFSLEKMWKQINNSRVDGYLINEVVEVDGIRSMATPIIGTMSRPVGALSISALRERLSGPNIADKVSSLQNAVATIQSRLKEAEFASMDL